jgi:hypothetical protein
MRARKRTLVFLIARHEIESHEFRALQAMDDRQIQSQSAGAAATAQSVGKTGLIIIHPPPEQETVEDANDFGASLHSEQQGSNRTPAGSSVHEIQ